MSKRKFISEYPHLMKQWDKEKNTLNPEETAAHTHKFAWWLCEKGHSWDAMIKNRVVANSGCPVCAGKKIVVGFNDLGTTEPKIAKEWCSAKNGNLTPEMVTRHTHKVVWWQCNEGHIWDMSVSHRSVGYGCPICSNKRVLAGYNDLLTLNPHLAAEWDYDENELLPSQVTVSSSKHVFWKCSKGHSWKAKISARNNGGTGCPVCNGKIVQAGFNDLQTHNPKLADEWDIAKNKKLPSQVTPYSTKKVWWLCEKGHSWLAAISGRSVGNGCPVCSGRKVLVGYNDLATVNPALAAEWDFDKNDIQPTQVTARSSRTVWWKCGEGHSWETAVGDRHSYGTDCPICSGHKVLAGFNDLETLNPELAAEWDYEKNTMLPSQVTVFSSKSVWWKCQKGHSWQTGVASRSKGTSCPNCVGRISYTPKCVY